MKAILSDLVKYTSNQIKIIKITGTDAMTRIQGVDDNKLLFLEAQLKNPIVEFKGQFGIGNLDLLKGILNLPAYKNEDNRLNIKRRDWNDTSTVQQFEFFDENEIGCEFRCMSPERVPDQAEISNISWDVQFEPATCKLVEFAQMANLFGGGEVREKLFGLLTDSKQNLIVTFGDSHSANHKGKMVFEKNIKGIIKNEPLWSHSDFTNILKIANGNDIVIKISSRGVICIAIDAPIGSFEYYLRAQDR